MERGRKITELRTNSTVMGSETDFCPVVRRIAKWWQNSWQSSESRGRVCLGMGLEVGKRHRGVVAEVFSLLKVASQKARQQCPLVDILD